MQTASESVKIGVLDADLGGLPLAAAIASRWPMVSVCYLADTAHRPLGERSPGLVRRCLEAGIYRLHRLGTTRIILASQTMAALRASEASEAGLSIIDPVQLAAIAAADASPGGRIGVIASRATVDSGVYPQHVQAHRPDARVHTVAAPPVGPLLDAGRENSLEGRMIVKKNLHRLKVRQVDTLILGTSRCGPMVSLIQRKIGRQVRLIDPLALVRQRLVLQFGAEPSSSPEPTSPLRLLVTDDGPVVMQSCQRLLRRRVEVEPIRL